MRRLFPRLLTTLALVSATARAITPQEAEFFEKQVRPVLADHCYKCHGPEKQKAELRVDSREFLLKGSENGAVVVPGKPGEGEFLKSIRHEGETKMPEKKPKLPDAQIAALTEWVRMGLPWPETDQAKLSAQQQAAKSHWSFQPVKKPAVPATASDPIDAFILAKLEQAGLKPSPPADARTLIRRATLDLTGLPPTIEEVEAFAADSIRDPQPSGARQTAEGGPQGEGGAPSQSAIRNPQFP